MSTYQDLKHRILQIQSEGRVIAQLEIAHDAQQEIMAEILGQVDNTPPDVLKDAVALANGESTPWLGLTFLEGFCVVSRPAGSGITIVYH